MTNIVPADVRTAARRGFIRTSAQTLASAVPATGVALALDAAFWQAVGLGAASAVVSSVLAGLASYLSILSSGIPADYTPSPPTPPEAITP